MKKGTYYFSNLAKYHIHTVNAKLRFAVNCSYNNTFKYKIPIFRSKEKKSIPNQHTAEMEQLQF